MGGQESQLDQDPLPEALVEQIAKGQTQAEQALVSKYWRGLYFILNRRTNNPDLAQDLAQETFIIVIDKARKGEINNPAALSAFIRQVGINLTIAHYRKETRHGIDYNNDFHLQISDNSPDLYRLFHSEQIFKFVTQLIDELKVERDREILKSYFIYEQEKSEICEKLGLSAEHFDRVLYRARNRLMKLIEFNLGSDLLAPGTSDAGNIIVILLVAGTMVFPAFISYKEKFSEKIVREKNVSYHLTKQKNNGCIINQGEELPTRSTIWLRAV